MHALVTINTDFINARFNYEICVVVSFKFVKIFACDIKLFNLFFCVCQLNVFKVGCSGTH